MVWRLAAAKASDASQDRKLAQIEQTLLELTLREGELRECLREKEAVTINGVFVINTRSGCWHEQAANGSTIRCGLAFPEAPHELADRFRAAAWHDICDRCMPLRRRAVYRRQCGRLDAEPETADE